MSIVERIKKLTPKQWAMIAGGVAAVGLGIDYYRRGDASLVSRTLEKIHPSPPPPPPPPQQAQPSAPPPSSFAAPPSDMGMFAPQFQMPAEYAVVEEVPGVVYWGGPVHDFHGGWPSEHHVDQRAMHALHVPTQPSHPGAPPAHHR